AHTSGQQRLADDVVDLVRPGVREILTLEQDAHPQLLGKPLARGDGRGPPGVVAQDGGPLVAKGGVAPRAAKGFFQLHARGNQRLGDVPSSELAEPARGAGVTHQTAWRRHPSSSCQSCQSNGASPAPSYWRG